MMTRTLIYIFTIFLSSSYFGQIHPAIKSIFYNLPLDKSRQDLREAIANDRRFISKDTNSNIFQSSMHNFLGITADRGLIKSQPDSVEILLAFGNTPLAIKRDGQTDFRDVLILNCKYFYSSDDSMRTEYKRLLNIIHPILKDSNGTKIETVYSKGSSRGHLKTHGTIFESFEPYYSVEVSSATLTPANGLKSTFGLYIEFRKEDR
jgi:hypothetical protein